MGLGRCMATPPRPSWDLAMGLGMEKPKAVAGCLLAGYREWTIKGFKGQDPKLTTIDPDMEKADQLIEDDNAARFDELVGRVSHISKDKLDKSNLALPDHEKLLRYHCCDSGGNEAPGSGGHGDERRALGGHPLRCGSNGPCFLAPLPCRVRARRALRAAR